MEPLNYKSLKQNLIKGRIEPQFVFDELLKADQTNATHEAAASNLTFLVDEEIRSYMEQKSESGRDKYFWILSLTQWHRGQNELFKNRTEEGLEFLKKSLKNANLTEIPPLNTDYQRGSIAYLEKDERALKDAIIRLKDSDINKRILKNMLRGLRERGIPDYPTDYMKD